MRLIAMLGVATAIGLCAGAAAADPPNFDFNGYAQIPTIVGGTLTVRSVLTNNGVVPTPVVLDFATNQYTLVIDGVLSFADAMTQQYAIANVTIFEDPIASGTTADYANPATFTDGNLILGGTYFPNVLTRYAFTPSLGNFIGSIEFDTGDRLGDLPGLPGWPCGGGWSRSVSGIPAGYEENWDGVIDLTAVAVAPRSWQEIKQLYK